MLPSWNHIFIHLIVWPSEHEEAKIGEIKFSDSVDDNEDETNKFDSVGSSLLRGFGGRE